MSYPARNSLTSKLQSSSPNSLKALAASSLHVPVLCGVVGVSDLFRGLHLLSRWLRVARSTSLRLLTTRGLMVDNPQRLATLCACVAVEVQSWVFSSNPDAFQAAATFGVVAPGFEAVGHGNGGLERLPLWVFDLARVLISALSELVVEEISA